MNKNSLKFKKSDSFYIRDGWLEKAINAIAEHKGENIFAKNRGNSILGLGTNMVRGLRYWLQASNIINSRQNKTELTEFGNLLLKYDRYIETKFSLFMIHYFLATNLIENPIAYSIFNLDYSTFTRNDAIEAITLFLEQLEFDVKREFVEEDLVVFLKSYYDDNKATNPEDNYICPLSSLKLISKRNNKYVKTKPHYRDLSYLIVYYSLYEIYKDCDSFNIEDSLDTINSPYSIFNLDKTMYLQYLEEMRKNGLITINKTAGLNTVYVEQKYDLNQIFEKQFGGKEYV